MRWFRSSALVGAAFLVFGCAANQLTPEQQSELATINSFPLEFTMPSAEASAAWGRAQSFVGRFSSMKRQTATDYVIQTYNPSEGEVRFGYYITKTPLNADVQFDVRCVTGNMFSTGEATQNAHVLAYYMKTGQLT